MGAGEVSNRVTENPPQFIPRFGLIIGAMKCGTSALFSSLRKHPGVAACRLKEPRFFFDDAERAKGTTWYLDLFDYDPTRHVIAVEAGTRNTMVPLYSGAARRMLDTGWNFRFVYLVRDPIERIEAHYMHGAVADFGLSSLSAGVDFLPVQFSRYHYQLEPYRVSFGRESLLVITQEELRSNPEQTLSRVCHHFGLDSAGVGRSIIEHSSEYTYRRVLLIRALRNRSHVPHEISLDNVLDYFGTLPIKERLQIEAQVNSCYRLTRAQIDDVRRELAKDMLLLQDHYAIDVARWGFPR